MAKNVRDARECDVCGAIFRIKVYSYHHIELLHLADLSRKMERIKDIIGHGYDLGPVATTEYDVCGHCLLAIGEVILARRELDNG